VSDQGETRGTKRRWWRSPGRACAAFERSSCFRFFSLVRAAKAKSTLIARKGAVGRPGTTASSSTKAEATNSARG
jgi:hypothetical protein